MSGRLTAFAVRTIATCAVLCGSATVAVAQSPNRTTDSTAVVTVAMQFHESLARGDSAAAANLLASDVTVLESGAVESRSDYLGHHLSADIAFAK